MVEPVCDRTMQSQKPRECRVMNPPRIYLDNAATSWPKPPAVNTAVTRYLHDLGAPAGRSTYREATEVERLLHDTRRRAAEWIGAGDPKRIIFTANGTDSLNLALHGLLQPGDHVVTTVVEHNSVLRPLRYLEEHRDVQVTRVACDWLGIVDPDDIAAALRDNTRLIAMIHASNVTGAVQPIAEVGRLARQRGVRMLVDAAQSLGHLPLDIRTLDVDLLAAPGHKGLLGLLGTGLLYVAPGVETELASVRQGGTGTRSDDDHQPDSLPDKYEAGNHNVPGLIGLGTGIAYLADRGLEQIQEHEQRLTARLLDGLGSIAGITIHGPRDVRRQVGVVSISMAGLEPQVLAMMLDASCGVQVRAGIHCAPRLHAALGTAALGGTVRFSVGAFNTLDEIDAAIGAVEELTATVGH
jgi:cysteine desulfurase/selenocysteine lyase